MDTDLEYSELIFPINRTQQALYLNCRCHSLSHPALFREMFLYCMFENVFYLIYWIFYLRLVNFFLVGLAWSSTDISFFSNFFNILYFTPHSLCFSQAFPLLVVQFLMTSIFLLSISIGSIISIMVSCALNLFP